MALALSRSPLSPSLQLSLSPSNSLSPSSLPLHLSLPPHRSLRWQSQGSRSEGAGAREVAGLRQRLEQEAAALQAERRSNDDQVTR
eukprot:1653330-Rhodomonas_salina.1